MKKEYLEFLGEFMKVIAAFHQEFRNNDCNIEIKDDSENTKQYWTIEFHLRYSNAEYKNVIVFYPYHEDDFNPTDIIEEAYSILRKAKDILKG